MLGLIGALAISAPAYTEAGFFSGIVRFFTGEAEGATIDEDSSASATISFPLLGSQAGAPPLGESGYREPEEDGPSLPVSQDSALIGVRNPLGTMPPENQGEIAVYTVKLGDTPSSIAANFGISLNTLLWANNIKNSNSIKTGDELVILPVSGIKYEIKKGDTLESIAKKFKGDVGEIIGFNGLAVGEVLEIGTTIILPDGELEIERQIPSFGKSSTLSRLPEYIGYFLRPIIGGRNVRATKNNPHGLHGYNGVDLANGCGFPVAASAKGTVILTRSSGWNGGYGKYVVITHPNGAQTLYAHLSSIGVAVGQTLTQGFPVGFTGSTGNSTGCHVHFEIRGARNPF